MSTNFSALLQSLIGEVLLNLIEGSNPAA